MKNTIIGFSAMMFVGLFSAPIMAQETPVQHYRDGSISLTAGNGFGIISGNNKSSLSTLTGFQFNLRTLIEGVMIEGDFGAMHDDAINGLDNGTLIVPKLSLGYVIPMSSHSATTLSWNIGGVFDTDNSNDIAWSMTGSIGTEFFLGRNAFIEPYVSVGNFAPKNGDMSFLYGAGYNLGVVF